MMPTRINFHAFIYIYICVDTTSTQLDQRGRDKRCVHAIERVPSSYWKHRSVEHLHTQPSMKTYNTSNNTQPVCSLANLSKTCFFFSLSDNILTFFPYPICSFWVFFFMYSSKNMNLLWSKFNFLWIFAKIMIFFFFFFFF